MTDQFGKDVLPDGTPSAEMQTAAETAASPEIRFDDAPFGEAAGQTAAESSLPTEEEPSVDELIRSTREDINRYDALMGEVPSTEVPSTRPLQEAAIREDEDEYEDEEDEEELSGWKGLPFGIRTFIYVASVLIVSMALAIGVWILADDVCALTGEDRMVTFVVEDDFTVDEVTADLKQAGLVEYEWLFKLYCKLANAEKKILPGTYDLNELLDYHALVNALASVGQRTTVDVTIPEGFECEEIFRLLETKGVCTEQELWEAAAWEEFEYDFLSDLPAGDPNRLEGCLFPDTYEFYVDDTPRNVLNKMLRNMDRKLTDEMWEALDVLNQDLRMRMLQDGFTQTEIDATQLSMYDILIVASLIEKESAINQENPVIASVIYNRLCSRTYPCLNIDATIQYILPERKAELTKHDTLIDSPYNTYKYPGLPVGAIASPGTSAIRGALFPKNTDYFFYALGDDGAHIFSTTYDEHLKVLGKLEETND